MTISASTSLRVVVLLTSVALALLLLLAGSVAAGTMAGGDVLSATGATTMATTEHRVRPGDTLWEIASGYTSSGDDVRVTIHDIMEANGLDSSVIAVGQVLVIPLEF